MENEIEAYEIPTFKIRELPRLTSYFFGGALYLCAAYITLISIAQVFSVFNLSIAAGLVLVFTPLGWLFFGPGAALAWAAPSILVDATRDIQNNWEYYIKLILGYIAALVVPYLVFGILMIILGFILQLAGIEIAN